MTDDQSTQPADDAQQTPASDESQTQVQPDTQSEIEQLQSDLQNEQQARMQLMADFDNFRKRMEVEKAKFGAMANMQLIIQLLDLVDDVQLAMNDEEFQAERPHGVLQIISDKIVSSLNSVGVDRVDINVGDKFDPQMMEALTTIPAPSAEQDNTVSQIVSSPFRYRQDGSLLKSAKVIVHKFKTPN